MPFNLIEFSEETSPIYLFKINSGTDEWFFTNHVGGYTYSGDVYLNDIIGASEIELTNEEAAKGMEIEVSLKNTLFNELLANRVAKIYYMTIFKVHLNDIDEEVKTYWTGILAGHTASVNSAKIVCKSLETAFNRNALFKSFSSSCQNFLYDARCKVNPTLPQFRQNATITFISGSMLSSPDFATWVGYSHPTFGANVPIGWWATGFIELASGELRMITKHNTTTTVELTLPFTTLEINDTVKIYAGCLRDFVTCDGKFGNAINYGGFPYIPKVNIFQYGIKS